MFSEGGCGLQGQSGLWVALFFGLKGMDRMTRFALAAFGLRRLGRACKANFQGCVIILDEANNAYQQAPAPPQPPPRLEAWQHGMLKLEP